jgi:hypothetical protein
LQCEEKAAQRAAAQQRDDDGRRLGKEKHKEFTWKNKGIVSIFFFVYKYYSCIICDTRMTFDSFDDGFFSVMVLVGREG